MRLSEIFLSAVQFASGLAILFSLLLFGIVSWVAVYATSPGTVRMVADIAGSLVTVQGVLLAFSALGQQDIQRRAAVPWMVASLILGLITLMLAFMWLDVPSATFTLDAIKGVSLADLVVFLISVGAFYSSIVYRSDGK